MLMDYVQALLHLLLFPIPRLQERVQLIMEEIRLCSTRRLQLFEVKELVLRARTD